MWFRRSKEKESHRHSKVHFEERRMGRLWVQSRSSVKSKPPWRWVGGVLGVLISLLLVTVVGWVGLRFLERWFFRQNDLFRIRDFKIECMGEVISTRHVMDYAQLWGCSNLFALNIAEKQNYLLRTVPRLESVEIARRLPGELIIKVRERISIARLEMDGYYMTVDSKGVVLGASASAAHLPVISGHGMPGIRPGTRLAGTSVMNALEVFNVCETTQWRTLFKVVRIDVRNRERVELSLADGERVPLAWQPMGTRDALSREHLELKLLKLAEILKVAAARGKRIAVVDMTLENNFPVEYY